MNKKIFLLFVLSLISNNLLYGEDNTEKIIRKNDTFFRMVDNKLIKLDNAAITIKLREGKVLSKNVKTIRSNKLGYIDIEVPKDLDIEDYVAYLKSTDDYEIVKYNEIAETAVSSNDTWLSYQWYLGEINSFSTWDLCTGNSNVKVAVIDNGFDWTHEDLGFGNDTYRNIDPSLGYNYYLNSTSMTKKNHGTQVSGIISAKTNNGLGIAGIAGGFGGSGVKILPFCVTDGTDKGINMGCVDDAICLAVDNGAKVINMSFRSKNTNLSAFPDVVDAIDYAYSHGVTLVAATGNDSLSYICFPACYPKVIAVGAMNLNHKMRPSSNYGDGIDLVAPGEMIYSTNTDNNYDFSSGTSCASPQVASVAALMLSINPLLSPYQIKSKITDTCTKLSDYTYDANGWESHVGYGLLNAYAAVCAAFVISGPTMPEASSVYYIQNLPSGYNVTWTYTPHSGTSLPSWAFIPNSPTTNQCTIDNFNKNYINGTLTATITNGSTTITTLEKEIRSGDGFLATCSQPLGYIEPIHGNFENVENTSADFSDNAAFAVKKNSLGSYPVTITSPFFSNATITHTSISGLSWQHSGNTITLSYPANDNLDPVLVVTGKSSTDYRVYRFSIYSQPDIPLQLTAMVQGRTVTLALVPDEEAAKDYSVEALSRFVSGLAGRKWDVTVSDALTGKVVYECHTTGASLEINAAEWASGIYVIKASIGNQMLTQKIFVN